MVKKKTKKASASTIALNKKARHEYFIEETYEAGVELQGWEVKSLRAGKGNISDAYVILKNNQAYLLGGSVTPLDSASSHLINDPDRSRKLLMKRRELDRLQGLVDRQSYTLVALELYWKGAWVKLKLGLAKGKQTHDKRTATKDREWQVEKGRMMKSSLR